MRTSGLVVLTALLAALAATGGYLAHRYLSPAPGPIAASVPLAATVPATEPAPLTGQPRPDFALHDVAGREHHVREWDGKVLVINFWATWCPPCLEEIPMFNALQDELGARGLQFLGVAIDEAENVRAFAEEHAMRYPTLYGQLDAIDVGKRYGNRLGALPYTVVVSREGVVVHTHAGPLDRATTEALVADYL